MSSQQQSQLHGPPYASQVAGIGGLPTPKADIPPTAVFLALYVTFAAINMTILQINLRRKHVKFLASGAIFGFCMARITTCILRIAWATHQHNVRLAMTASILVNAGILIVYVINIIFSQRILRAKQPQLGWHKVASFVPKVLYSLIGLALAGVITSVVLTSYSLNAHVHQVARDIQLAASTYLFVFTMVPWFFLAAAHFLPRSTQEEHFGHGSLQRKTLVVLATSSICVLISGFKMGSNWMPPRPAAHPAWYQSKAAFYIFNFSLEIVILTLITAARVDKLFHVPDGSKGPGDYTGGRVSSGLSSPAGEVEEIKI